MEKWKTTTEFQQIDAKAYNGYYVQFVEKLGELMNDSYPAVNNIVKSVK